VESFPVRSNKKPLFLQEGIAMSQKLGSFALISGCFLMLVGLAFIPAALSEHQDETILGAGMCAFAFGAFAAAAGMYVKARALQAAAPRGMVAAPQKQRGGCEICKSETPVVLCRVHNVHICGSCLTKHYDFRSCVYIPSTRRSTPAKLAARAARV
jgi:hypothetical protein